MSSSEESYSVRPNKFTGPKPTWLRFTEEERQVVTSMNQLRDLDLSIHLYNTHAMKHHYHDRGLLPDRKPWANKDNWSVRNGKNKHDTSNFVPPKSWTAWPLSAHMVPRAGLHTQAEDENKSWTLRKNEAQRPSRDLEENLVGITLRIAKKRFERREWDSTQKGLKKDSRDLYQGTASTPEVGDLVSRKSAEVDLETNLTVEQPIISADDERSVLLLRPTVRHTLSQLDELLMALHHARKSCLGSRSEQAELQSETKVQQRSWRDQDSSDTSLTPALPSANASLSADSFPPKRHVGRPRKTLQIPPTQETEVQESNETSKQERRGRRKVVHAPLEGESYPEMLVRIARLQKRRLPFQTSAPSENKQSSLEKGHKKRRTSSGARKVRSSRLGVRDWSEIVGAATLVGFPSEVIARTTQRCADLFGEGMTLLSLFENPAFEHRSTPYLPSRVPDLDILDDKSMSDDNSQSNRSERKDLTHTKHESFCCPYPWCICYDQGFSGEDRLVYHLKAVHRMEEKDLPEKLDATNQLMVGGVHVDGFLQQIKRRSGWRGMDGKQRRKRSRKRNTIESSEDTGESRNLKAEEDSSENGRETDHNMDLR